MDSNQVAEAKGRYAEAERATSLKGKAELYFSASKLYLNAVNSVTDDNLKRSLIYLSNVCISKATSCMSSREVLPSRPADDECASLMLNSERAIQQAHVAKQLRTEDIPQRNRATAVQVVRDMLALESALATIGFANPNKGKNKAMTSAELLRSTFAFNSDLGESFMVLDTRNQKHMASSSIYQASHRGSIDGGLNTSNRRPPAPSTAAAGHTARTPAVRQDPRMDARHLQNTRIEIENELNNPLVQSYLSTHAPSPMAKSRSTPFDFDNLTQSAISTFNKDTIDNTEGVLNLLQTVRRIGDENAQLLLKIEFLSDLDKQSARVYKDIEQFKLEFTEKFECVRDMLAEFAENALTPSVEPSATASSKLDASSPGPSTVAVPAPSSAHLLEKLGEVIQKELEARRGEVADRAAALAAAEAERAAAEKARAKSIAGGGAASHGDGGIAARGGAGVAGIAGPGQGTGIAEKANTHPMQRPGERQEQLEKMVKALLARLEKSNKEIAKKNELLDKYVRIINQFQKDHPQAKMPALEASILSTQAESSSTDSAQPATHSSRATRGSSTGAAGKEGGAQQGESEDTTGPSQSQSLDLTHAAVVASGAGGVVSTYRKPPSASSPRTHAADGHGGVLSPTRSSQPTAAGMPGAPGAAVRSGSGGAAAGMRKSSMLPPRTKHHSTTTLEAMQNAKM